MAVRWYHNAKEEKGGAPFIIKADAKFKMSEITPNVKVARCKTP